MLDRKEDALTVEVPFDVEPVCAGQRSPAVGTVAAGGCWHGDGSQSMRCRSLATLMAFWHLN